MNYKLIGKLSRSNWIPHALYVTNRGCGYPFIPTDFSKKKKIIEEHASLHLKSSGPAEDFGNVYLNGVNSNSHVSLFVCLFVCLFNMVGP